MIPRLRAPRGARPSFYGLRWVIAAVVKTVLGLVVAPVALLWALMDDFERWEWRATPKLLDEVVA